MSIVAIIKTYILVIAMLLLNGVGLAIQASAISQSSHSMSGTSHVQSKTTNCMSSCTTYPIKHEDETATPRQEKEPNPLPPQTQAYLMVYLPELILNESYETTNTSSLVFRPPDITKLYVTYRF